MDDNKDAASRREARRRRILQNPEERMRKLKGLSEAETSPNETNHVHEILAKSAPLEEPEVVQNEVQSRKVVSNNTVTTPFQSTPLFEVASTALTEDDPPGDISAPSPQPISLAKRIIGLKLHIIVLAVAVRILLAIRLGSLFGEMILVPLFVIEFPIFVMDSSRGEQGTGLLGAALILSGIGQSKTHSLLRTVCVLQEIATDLAIYIFIFLLCHVAFLWLGIS